MLPDLMKTLQSAPTDKKINVLLILRNVMGHLKKKASSTALELAGKLLQLFDDVRLPWKPELRCWALCKNNCPFSTAWRRHLPRAIYAPPHAPALPRGWLLVSAAQPSFSLTG